MPRIELPAAIVRSITGPVLDVDLVVLNRDPAPDETGVPRMSAIAFELHALRGSALDAGELRVRIDGALAIVSGVIQPAYRGPGAALEATPRRLRAALDPVVPFDSEATVEVAIELGGLAERYAFRVEDRRAPRVLGAVALDRDLVRVGFDEPVRAGPGATVALHGRAIPAVPLTAVQIEQRAPSTLDIVVAPEMSVGAEYELVVAGVVDVAGNPVLAPYDRVRFTGYRPSRPTARRFELWTMLPKYNRRADADGEFARFVACLQEVVDLLLSDIDRMPREIDLDRARPTSIHTLLADLGNPFAIELDDSQRRRLAGALIDMYRLKGTALGILRALEFFIGLAVEILPYASSTLVLGESELGIDWELGPSERFARYAFDVRSARVLTPSERRLVRLIVDYLKPAHTHFVELFEPAVLHEPDHWELGESELDLTAWLH
jgi:phage tail-like protein